MHAFVRCLHAYGQLSSFSDFIKNSPGYLQVTRAAKLFYQLSYGSLRPLELISSLIRSPKFALYLTVQIETSQ